ncbi:lasso RiPP family leader peptide-containing protein [Actinophytocola sp.]|uniref:lasso RiPP family leader peptide-containing protein n=1 Tax=Actinophytocola sp. TaxID=1872138 RepID=UPI002ED4309D
MKLFRIRKTVPAGASDSRAADLPVLGTEPSYEPPRVSDLGHVRELTLGSSSSGNADSNSQYYW